MIFIARAALDDGIFSNPSSEAEDGDREDGRGGKAPLVDTGRPVISPLFRGVLAAAGLLIVALSLLPIVRAADMLVHFLLLGGLSLYVGVAGAGNVWEPEPTPPHPAYLQRRTPSAPDAGDATPSHPHADSPDAPRSLGAADASFQPIAARSPAEPAPVQPPGAG